MKHYDTETTIQLPDEEDVDVLVEFTVTSWGSPGTGPSLSHSGDPPEPPEFDITKVTRLDSGEDITRSLTNEWSEQLYNIVAEEIYEIDGSRGYDDY